MFCCCWCVVIFVGGSNEVGLAASRARANGLSVDPWFAPIVADAEAGFGGPLNSFELMKAYIEAGAAGACSSDVTSGLERLTVLGVLGDAVELSLSLTLRFLLVSPREPPLDVDDATDARRTALPLALRGDAGVELVGVTSCVGVLTLRKLRSH